MNKYNVCSLVGTMLWWRVVLPCTANAVGKPVNGAPRSSLQKPILNGNNVSKQLIESALVTGADAIKFQSFIASEEISFHAEKALYQSIQRGNSESQLEMASKYELCADQQFLLKEFADRVGIEFMSSAFDIPSIRILEKIGIRRWKIPSGEITNLPYLRQIGLQGQPIILSTGMASLGEIETALSVLEKAGTCRSMITVLHCTTE